MALVHFERGGWRNVWGWIALVLLSPLILITMIVVVLLKPFTRPVERSADEVAGYLRDCIDSTGDEWDFDDFTSIQIADPRLESIRDRAAHVLEPIDEDGKRALHELLVETNALIAESTATSETKSKMASN